MPFPAVRAYFRGIQVIGMRMGKYLGDLHSDKSTWLLIHWEKISGDRSIIT